MRLLSAILSTNKFYLYCSLLIFNLIGLVISTKNTSAQIVPDSTLPNNTEIFNNGNLIKIEGGTTVGKNLFHSFEQFSLITGNTAFFNSASNIESIFSRVTGNSISNIDGLIKANGTADLFLINPNGIIFGENASLDIGGSFLGSTAESIIFSDSSEFSAINPAALPLLTINIPVGLQMGSNPGNIEINGNGHQLGFNVRNFSFIRDARPLGIQVPSGKTLALIGGDIFLQGGNLTAQGGGLELGSISESTEVKLIPTSAGFTVAYDGVNQFGDINLSQATSIEVSGEGGGNVQLQGGNISLGEDSVIIANTQGNKNGGLFDVEASKSVEIIGSGLLIFPTGFFNAVDPGAAGNAGNVTVNTPQLTMSGASLIRTSTSGIGNGGQININTDRLVIHDGAKIVSGTTSHGNAGSLTIVSKDSVEISGSISLPSGEVATGLFSTTIPGSKGNAGNMSITTPKLEILGGGKVTVQTQGSGNGGNITIRTEEITVADSIIDFRGVLTGLVANVAKEGSGNGGSLDIEAKYLLVYDGGQITASTDGMGNAGTIDIRADEIDVAGESSDGLFRSAITSSSTTNFNAGSINLNSNQINIRDRGNISVSNLSGGDAGNLTLNAKTISLEDRASLQANVAAGNEGNINLNSQLLLMRNNSNITTNAVEIANGGNITINSPVIVGLKNSDIIADAIEGNGGNINITTQGIFGLEFRDSLTPESDITASSQFGVNGRVKINDFGIDPNSDLVELPTKFRDSSHQFVSKCFSNTENTFVYIGKGGLAENPSHNLRGESIWEDLRDFSITPANSQTAQTVIEANAWNANELGDIQLLSNLSQTEQNSHEITFNKCKK